MQDPTMWNNGFWSGMLVADTAIIATRAVTKNALSNGGITEILSLTGGIVGMAIGKNRMRHDFKQAVALRDQQQANTQALITQQAAVIQQLQMPQKTAPASYKNSVSGDETQALETRLAAVKETHVEKQAAAENAPATEAAR